MSRFKASTSNLKWDRDTRGVDDDEEAEARAGVTDDEAAEALAAGHPKSTPPSIKQNPTLLPGAAQAQERLRGRIRMNHIQPPDHGDLRLRGPSDRVAR